MNLITGHHLLDLPPIPYDGDAGMVDVAREGVRNLAKDHAVERLIATARVVLDLMPIAENRALHARLRSDIEAVRNFGLGE